MRDDDRLPRQVRDVLSPGTQKMPEKHLLQSHEVGGDAPRKRGGSRIFQHLDLPAQRPGNGLLGIDVLPNSSLDLL